MISGRLEEMLDEQYMVMDSGELRDGPVLPMKWLCLGPFVRETDEAPETEYLYKRHLVLEEDFLRDCGGEATVYPCVGQTVDNPYFGPDRLAWQVRRSNRGDQAEFTFDGDYDALYRTIQRSCAYYLCTYIRCARETPVVLTMLHSGARVYLGDRLVYEEAYGYAHGINRPHYAIPLLLANGLNRILIKLRTGSIADGVDFSVRNALLHPVRALAGNIGATRLEPPDAFSADRVAGPKRGDRRDRSPHILRRAGSRHRRSVIRRTLTPSFATSRYT